MAGNNVVITVSVNNNTHTGFNAVNQGLRSVQVQANNTNQAVNNFTRDSSGRLRDAQGRFAVAGAGMVNTLQGVSGAATSTAGSLGPAGGGLSGVVGGLGAVIGMSALPALGALAPMLLGVAAAGAVVSLAMDDIKKEAKTLKPEFEGLQKAASKAIMPGVKSMFKDLKVAMKELEPAVTVAGKAMGDMAAQAGKFAKSPAFQKALLQNVKMGSEWFKEFGASLGKLTQSFLEFGAKSKPTLDALGGGINDVLGIGLPGMFKGLEKGIEGSAKMFDGLFDAINLVLPAFGRLSGALADTFGPLLGSLFRFFGDLAAAIMDAVVPALNVLAPAFGSASEAMDESTGFLRPLIKALGEGLAFAARLAVIPLKNFFDTMKVILPLMKDLGGYIAGPFIETFEEMTGASDKVNGLNGKLTDLSNWANNHRAEIREVFRLIANAIMDMVIFGVNALPILLQGLRMMSIGALEAFDAILTGAAGAFGWIPGIGDKLKGAKESFDVFKGKFIEGLGVAQEKAEEFAGAVTPKLQENKLRMDISNWTTQIDDAKEQLKDKNLPPGKRAKLTADIKNWQDKIAEAERNLRNMTPSKTTYFKGNKSDFDSKRASVFRAKVPNKTSSIKADTRGFWNTVNGLIGRTVGSVFVSVKAAQSSFSSLFGFAHGGIVGQAASGGARSRLTLVGEQGPELVDLAPGSRVRSNDDTRRMFSGAGGGDQRIVLEINSSGTQTDEMLIEIFRKAIRVRGGNVQTVLGR